MTRERIEDFREVLLPFMKKRLLAINYENRGKSDAEEFEKDFNEICDLAIKALEQEPTTKNDLGVDAISRQALLNATVKKSSIWNKITDSKGENLEAIISKLPPVIPQEPLKPMVEIDLYSVIKQKYIEREVLDKIRAEIERLQKMCDKDDLNLMAQYSAFGMVLDILDKYKTETEADNRNDDNKD